MKRLMAVAGLTLLAGFVCCGGLAFLGDDPSPSATSTPTESSPTSSGRPRTTPPPTRRAATDPEVERLFQTESSLYNEALKQWEAAVAARESVESALSSDRQALATLESQQPAPPVFEEREWSTFDRKYTTIATLMDTDDTNVVLQQSDGKRLEGIKKEQLKGADRIYLSDAFEQLSTFKTASQKWQEEAKELQSRIDTAAQQLAAADQPKPVQRTREAIEAEVKQKREAKAAKVAAEKSAQKAQLAEIERNRPKLNKANWARIREGMTYSQVVAIIGPYEQELSSVEIPGTPRTVMYQWTTGQLLSVANANCTFQGGKLVAKAQFGL